MNENALQTMIQFEQAKSRAKSANKVALDEEKEKVSGEQEVQRVQQFETHPVTVDDDTECVKQSWDNRDLTDYRREATLIQNRLTVPRGSLEDVPPPQEGKEDPMDHSRLGLASCGSYLSLSPVCGVV